MKIDDVKISDLMGFLAGAINLRITDLNLMFEPECIKLVCTDPSHVAMATARYHISTGVDEMTEITVDLEDLTKALGQFAKTDTVSITMDNGRMTIKSATGRRTLRMLSREMTTPRIPQYDTPCVFEVDASELRKAMKFTNDISDHCLITCESGTMKIYTEDDTGAAAEYDLGACTAGSYRSMYPLDYLNNVVKAMPDSTVTLGFDNDFPIRVSATAAPIEIECLVAPRIEKD